MTNITFFGWNLHLLPGMKPVTSSSPEIYLAIMGMQKHGLYACGECYDMMLERTSKSVMLGMQISCPACRACQTQMVFTIGMPGMPSRTSKNWEWNISPVRDLGRKFSYNLGQNKMEKQIPIPPNQGWRRAKDKNAPFSHPWFGGGRGGLGFPFILSKIVGQFWAARVWTHFFHAYAMLFLSTNGPFNFVMPKYIKLRLPH